MWPVEPKSQVFGSLGDEVVFLAIGIVPVTRPLPGSSGGNEPGPNGVHVAIPHDLELMTAVLNLRRAEPFHNDLPATTGP